MAEKAPVAGQKIKRKFMAHFIDSALPDAGSPAYVRLGTDLEEFNVEMNANVETKNNILGDTSVTLDSYQPQASADPYYAVVGDPMFERLQGIVDERQTLDDLKTTVVEVHLWDEVSEAAGSFVAYQEEAIIEVSSYGGDTTGYQIPFNVHHTGNRVKGKFVLATKTFTADSE
ncbi:hypothetical protein DXB18_01305 [Clostridium sp. OM02-18AC]|uniref:hypothetical protein n=1 Tax=Clostridium sp. OM02-18AC TaxID=2292311 RepID=UPI000E4F7685|nr:hypothetical protein [Clostridium sp. OM02-18AC]RHV69840.1 hypothetical protein DXB18_01305 [Clostridium sp. OM02-18AC]